MWCEGGRESALRSGDVDLDPKKGGRYRREGGNGDRSAFEHIELGFVMHKLGTHQLVAAILGWAPFVLYRVACSRKLTRDINDAESYEYGS